MKKLLFHTLTSLILLAVQPINTAYAQDGSLDTTFNPGTGASSTVLTTALQPDGKIIIGGAFSSYNGTARNRVARLNADGSLDSTFNLGTGASGTVWTTTLQPDGKIIIGGSFNSYNGTSRNGIARLNEDGTLDASFNPGTGISGSSSSVRSIALQPDGKIIIGGEFNSYDGTNLNKIARLNADGSLDATFNPGISFIWGTVSTIALQPDGKIIIGGEFGYDLYFNTVTNIARLNADGTLDTAFNIGTGIEHSASVAWVNAIDIQPDGKIIVGGFFDTYDGVGSGWSTNQIIRLEPNGNLDYAFNQASGTGPNRSVSNVSIQLDGKVIIGGEFTFYNGTGRNGIARLNADGTLDATFNPGTGVNGNGVTTVYTTVTQPDGKIIIGGRFTSYDGTGRNRVARVLSTSPPAQIPELYGLMNQGGALGSGAIISIKGDSSNFTTHYNFGAPNAALPFGSLVEASNGKLYGMTSFDYSSFRGVLFEYDPATSTYTTIFNFDFTNGRAPFGSLMEASNGKLYGMTSYGGDNDAGVVFEYTPGDSTIVKKFDFDNTNGEDPRGALVEASNGKLYGMTSLGGDNDFGVLFEYTPGATTIVKKFDFDGADGRSPTGTLIEASNGELYGMTNSGGINGAVSGNGILFEYTPGATNIVKRFDFDDTNGKSPTGSLMEASNGKIYGMTSSGGTNQDGVLFEYNPGASTIVKKFDFDNTKGADPRGSLIEASNGKLYGMTKIGGTNDDGVIFEYTAGSTDIIVIKNLECAEGCNPEGHLIEVEGEDETSWTGNTNTEWNNTGNWSTGIVPGSSDDVIIPSVPSGGNFPDIEVDAEVNNIKIETGATLSIQSGQSITVEGTLTNDGTITVESGGALVQETGSTLAGSGTYNVQREITAGQRFIGSPINGHSVSGFGISPSGSNGAQVEPIESPSPFRCNADSVAANSPNGNILEMREDATPIDNCAQSLWHVKSTGSLGNGRGYAVNATTTTMEFSGTVNNATVNYSGLGRQSGNIDQWNGTQTRGWHLVSNPYPSPIRLSDGDLGGDFDNAVYLWDGSSFTEIQLNITDAVIAVGQGFQVRKSVEGGSATFSVDNSFREGGNPTFYKQGNGMDGYLEVSMDNQSHQSTATIYFEDGATAAFDPQYDAVRLFGSPSMPLLYTLEENGENLSYNALPLLENESEQTVPLSLYDAAPGEFTLSFDGIGSLNATVMLEDLKLSSMTEVTETSTYTFTTEADDSRDRFKLHFQYEEEIEEEEEDEYVGIAEKDLDKIRIFPNPTSGTVHLVLSENHAYRSVNIMDLSGRTVISKELDGQNNSYELSTRELSGGIYFIQLNGAEAQQTLKLIKQ